MTTPQNRYDRMMGGREVRRDGYGFGIPCEQPGCYEIGLEPDGKCERHGQWGREQRAAMKRGNR